jgi:predicted Rossmann fold nucleotide-binding protein DprA/Smf involved in DNA uptake
MSSTAPQLKIHRRTAKGQMMLVCRRCFLEKTQTSLLLLFNGFTPTATLLQRTARPMEQVSSVLDELERRGWIEQVA